MKTASALMFFALTASAQAGWQIQSAHDGLTGKQINFATLDAKSRDNDISATLELSCVNGARAFAIRISAHLTRGRLSAAYRIDEGSTLPRFLYVFSDPTRIAIVASPPFDLIGKKRFRIQLMPSGGPSYFYDFDLTGLGKASKAVRCGIT